MADLLSTFANAYPYDPNSVWRGAQGIQNVMSNALDFQQKREALEAQRGLRALYAQNPNPSYEDIARISPEFAMQQNKANFELQKEMLGAKKTQGEINEQEAAIFAKTGAQVAEKYAPKIMQGQFTQEDLSKFHQEMGFAMANVEKQYGIKPPPGANIEMLDPMSVLTNAAPYYKSPALDVLYGVQKQGMLNQMPPQMTAQQAYGGVEMGPYGPRRVPGIGGQPMTPGPQYGVTPFNPNAGQRQGASQQPAPYSFQGPSGAQFDMYDLGSAAQAAAALPAGPDKDAALKYIDEQWSKMRSGQGGEVVQPGQVAQPPAGGFITAPQEAKLRLEEEQAKAKIATQAAGERKAIESEVERKESKQKAMDAFALVPSLPEMEDLIAGSTSGKRQTEMAAQFEDWTGKATPGMKNIGRLGVIAGRLRDAVNRAPGSQSDKDAIIESLKTGDISNPELSAEKRLEAYREFVRQMRKMIKNETGIDAEPSTGESTSQAPVRVKTRADVEALPSGTLFMGDDGVMHRRK